MSSLYHAVINYLREEFRFIINNSFFSNKIDLTSPSELVLLTALLFPPKKAWVSFRYRSTMDNMFGMTGAHGRSFHPPHSHIRRMMDGSNGLVFVYTGPGGNDVPQDVVRVRVDPSVTSIPANAFNQRKKLATVELCEGLVEIREWSFSCCDHSIKIINIPNSLRRIEDLAFYRSLRGPFCLHDDIESIGELAFAHCIFTNFRVPPLITLIAEGMLRGCTTMFSLELPEDVTEIGSKAFSHCYSLRNVAFPPNAIIGNYRIFVDVDMEANNDRMSDLQRQFGLNARIISELQHRFDELPIHCIVYYQSYHQGVLQILLEAINMRSGQRRTLRSKLDPTGNQQDCLGMTPLHILACSSVHYLEVYRLIVEKYPTNLITEDRWGALPLLYAFWGAAPAEIIQFLLDSYQSLYPGHVFNWTNMVKTMGRTDTPKERIENLLLVKQIHFPEQPIDWDYLLDEFASNSYVSFPGAPLQERMRFLVTCGLSTRVEALPFKLWRDYVTQMIHAAPFVHGEEEVNNSTIMHRIQEKLAHFEDELPKLKEATTILELALWKKRMNDTKHQQNSARNQKKIKTEGTSTRQQCRVTCGADVVIGHVMPYLISTGDDDESLSNESDTDE
jgi:hypothetical protein